jgi:antitoxin ParD1/3/4
MPTRNVSLTPEQDAFIDEVLDKGEYRNASEAMRDAIRALQQRRKLDALKLERLRKSIDEGLADLDRGDYEEVDDEALESWLARSLIVTVSGPVSPLPLACRTAAPLTRPAAGNVRKARRTSRR